MPQTSQLLQPATTAVVMEESVTVIAEAAQVIEELPTHTVTACDRKSIAKPKPNHWQLGTMCDCEPT